MGKGSVRVGHIRGGFGVGILYNGHGSHRRTGDIRYHDLLSTSYSTQPHLLISRNGFCIVSSLGFSESLTSTQFKPTITIVRNQAWRNHAFPSHFRVSPINRHRHDNKTNLFLKTAPFRLFIRLLFHLGPLLLFLHVPNLCQHHLPEYSPLGNFTQALLAACRAARRIARR